MTERHHSSPVAKAKKPEVIRQTEQEAANQLVGELQFLTKEVEKLTLQARTLANHAELLTSAIDDVRAEIDWAITNLSRKACPLTQKVESTPHPSEVRKHVGNSNSGDAAAETAGSASQNGDAHGGSLF